MSEGMWPPERIGLTPGKRVRSNKGPELIRKQLYEGLDLRMEYLSVGDLLDDINTDDDSGLCLITIPQL